MLIKSYGDTLNDGAVQLSFTLPVSESAMAIEAAKAFVQKMGFNNIDIVHSQALNDHFTYFIAYGRTTVSIDLSSITVPKNLADDHLSFSELNDFITQKIKRKIVVVGACTGFDAHTVGIDAILNMKGYNHHYGLERYPLFEVYNLGAQITNAQLIEHAVKVNADAILVSQVVTQKDGHIENLTQLIEQLEIQNLRDQFIVICGGPRLNHKLALELGFDAGFSRGTYAEHVGTFIARKLFLKLGAKI